MAPQSLFLPLLIAASVLHPETPAPTADAPGFEIERVSWVGAVSDGGSVTVLNRFGDVRARFGGYEGRVEVFANVQHFADEGPRLEVETTATPSGVEVTVGFRAAPSGELVTEPTPGLRKRADLVVFVPSGAPLAATTDDGLLDLRGLSSDVRARTQSGATTARGIEGELDLRATTGDLLVLLESWNVERQHTFVSESGDLTIILAGEANAAVRVATSGLVSTDVSMEVDYEAERRPIRRGLATVGKGSTKLTITSDAGHVRLVQRPLSRDALAQPGEGTAR